MIDNTFFENLSQTIKSGYYQIEEVQRIDITTGPSREENENIGLKILRLILNILQRILDKIKQTYYNFKEILPKLFDTIIESLLEYSNSKKTVIQINFIQIYEIFELLGLEEINPETFDKISACVQWKIIPPDWISFDFLKNYKNSLLSNASGKLIESIDCLSQIIIMRKREELEYKSFDNELSKILID